MRRILTALFFLLTFQVIQAQHTISGLITDKKDNSVLIDGVTVFIPEFDRIDESREGGTYILRNIGIGLVHVQFSKQGYSTIVKIVNTADSATVVNVEMERDYSRSEIVSPTTTFLKLPGNTPYSLVQKDANQLRRMGNIKLMTSLTYEPGIDAITIGQISKPVIRGLSGSHILLVQSGSRILTNRLDERYDYELTDNGTSEIEIVKGPASLLYGDNAMGGVLIFKDEKMPPLGNVSGDINLSYFSSTVGLKSDIGVKGSSNNGLFYAVRIGGSSQTSYIQGEGFEKKKNTEIKNYAYNSGSAMADAKGIIGISKKWGETKVAVTYWKRQSELIQSFSDAEIELMTENEERNRKSMTPFIEQEVTLVSSQSTILVGKSKVDANISWQSYSRDGSYSTSATNYDFKYTTDPEKQSGFIFGTQGYFQNKDYTAYYSIYQSKLLSNSLYVLYRYDAKKFNVLAGGRYDIKNLTTPSESLNEDYNLFNGSAGIAWHPIDVITVKFNGATGNSIPDEERYYYNNMYYGYLFSNEINEESNYQGDLGFEWRHPYVTVNLDGFYNRITDYSYADTSNVISPSGEQFTLKQNDATIMGGEANASIHPPSIEWVNLNLGYSNLKGEFVDSKLSLPRMPAAKFVTALRFQKKRMDYLYNSFIEIMLRSYMKQDNVYVTETPTDGYSLLDLRIGGSFHWGMQSFDITLAVNNILDQDYFSHLSLTKNILPSPVGEMGRNVAVMVKFPFGIVNQR